MPKATKKWWSSAAARVGRIVDEVGARVRKLAEGSIVGSAKTEAETDESVRNTDYVQRVEQRMAEERQREAWQARHELAPHAPRVGAPQRSLPWDHEQTFDGEPAPHPGNTAFFEAEEPDTWSGQGLRETRDTLGESLAREALVAATGGAPDDDPSDRISRS